MNDDLRGFTLRELQIQFKELGIEPYRARQVFQWLYGKGRQDVRDMTNLPQGLRRKIAQEYAVAGVDEEEVLVSRDKTCKFLFRLKDGARIETVVIPSGPRLSVCLSTQVGCRFACRFCASGALGFRRNLATSEIVSQLIAVRNHFPQRRITHIVFMGIGEPLDNYTCLLKAIRIFNAPEGLHLGRRKMTISTVGLADRIERLAREGLQVELSISLHAANDRLRSSLLSINRKYPIAMLMEAVKVYMEATKRKVTFEYVLLGGYNTSVKDARELVALLRGKNVHVNLIVYNGTKADDRFSQPAKPEVLLFKNYLLKHGLVVTLRRTRGDDIQAACGQLRLGAFKKGRV